MCIPQVRIVGHGRLAKSEKSVEICEEHGSKEKVIIAGCSGQLCIYDS